MLAMVGAGNHENLGVVVPGSGGYPVLVRPFALRWS
jgi:hypothetical protein